MHLDRAACGGARFDDADLTYCDFSHADVCAAHFSGAKVFRARFHQVDARGTIWADRTTALGDDEDLLDAERWQPTH